MGFSELKDTFSWPKEKPNVVPNEEPKWFGPHVTSVFDYLIPRDSKIVLEIGSWLGTSIKFFGQHCPKAELIAVDIWEGLANHNADGTVTATYELEKLYDTFLVNTWELKERLVPVRLLSVTGMKVIKYFGVEPDVIYIDAAHDRENVFADISTAYELFPKALICGDDFRYDGVVDGLTDFMRKYKVGYRFNQRTWWLVK
jgi:predicted O-methyltransferase YrrM